MSETAWPCSEYDGDAVVQMVDGEPTWREQAPKIHISTGLRSEPDAWAFITAAYEVSPGCGEEWLHGDLRTQPTDPEASA